MVNKVRVFAPATVANVGPGFDSLGLAIEGGGDVMTIERIEDNSMVIENRTPAPLPLDPTQNVATIAMQAMLLSCRIEKKGFRICFEEKILPGSGLGSSASSAVAGVAGLNHLLGSPLSSHELMNYAMVGEQAADGSWHLDNVAPSLLGGIIIAYSYKTVEIISVPVPDALCCAVVHPFVEVKTADSRNVLPKEIPLSLAARQWGNLSALVAAFYRSDYALIRKVLHDEIVEPARAALIPHFQAVKQVAMETGALGCSIAGSGPSTFALFDSLSLAEQAAKNMGEIYRMAGIDYKTYASKINKKGTEVTVIE